MSFKGRTVVLLIAAAVSLDHIFMFTLMDSPLFVNGQSVHSSGSLTSSEIQKLSAVLGTIENQYVLPVERDKIVNGAVHGMIASLEDLYSSYMEKKEAEQFNQKIEGTFTGIGAVITMENNQIIVMSAIKGSPAEKAGIKSGDILVSVNGMRLDDKSLHETISQIRGPKGTKVEIVIKRAGQSTPSEPIVVIRDEMAEETVLAKKLDGHIGYIQIHQFSSNTFDHFKEKLELLEKGKIVGLVLDVRGNPGGSLKIVQQMAELFVPKGKPIVQIEDRDKKRSSYLSKGTSKVKPYPVVMLIDEGSASASEIMASALKESAGVTLIGQRTFGKGTVQAGYKLDDGGLIKLTTSKWLTGQGNDIHQKGVKPDIVVEKPEFYSVTPIPKNKTLVFDMNDANVKNVQIMLYGLRYNPGRKDGYFSKDTEAAVRVFQRDYHLEVNGEVDGKTREQLERAISKAIKDPKNDAQLHKAIDLLKKELG